MLTKLFTPIHSISRLACARALHTATADFITHGADGTLITSKVSIKICNPGEAYVMIPPEVGEALHAGSSPANISASKGGSAKSALSFFHDTQHFGNSKLAIVRWRALLKLFYYKEASSGYPRLVIPLQLPRQSAANSSPASLFLYGGMQKIALDGTQDGTSPALFPGHGTVDSFLTQK